MLCRVVGVVWCGVMLCGRGGVVRCHAVVGVVWCGAVTHCAVRWLCGVVGCYPAPVHPAWHWPAGGTWKPDGYADHGPGDGGGQGGWPLRETPEKRGGLRGGEVGRGVGRLKTHLTHHTTSHTTTSHTTSHTPHYKALHCTALYCTVMDIIYVLHCTALYIM